MMTIVAILWASAALQAGTFQPCFWPKCSGQGGKVAPTSLAVSVDQQLEDAERAFHEVSEISFSEADRLTVGSAPLRFASGTGVLADASLTAPVAAPFFPIGAAHGIRGWGGTRVETQRVVVARDDQELSDLWELHVYGEICRTCPRPMIAPPEELSGVDFSMLVVVGVFGGLQEGPLTVEGIDVYAPADVLLQTIVRTSVFVDRMPRIVPYPTVLNDQIRPVFHFFTAPKIYFPMDKPVELSVRVEEAF